MSGDRRLSVRLQQQAPIPLDAGFTCEPGTITALVGPSGSGKSTILRAIAGHYRPAHGQVGVGEEVWFDGGAGRWLAPHRRRAGMVFQSYALFPHMTAAGNVAAALGDLPKAQRQARAEELLAMVNLAGLEGRRPAELSGGQQQRVAVARALAREPLVLLLDEPFSAVDRATRERLYRELALLRERLAMPVLLVTHDLQEATMLADNIVVLHHGRTLQAGPPLEVMARPANPDVARLVEMRNLFEGTVVTHDAAGGRTVLAWAGRELEAAHQPHVPLGARVSWGIRTADIILHRKDRPSRGERENPVFGVVDSFVVFGESASLTMRTAQAAPPLHVTVPAHVARRNAIAKGERIGVSLLASGIHLMPAEDRPDEIDPI